MSGKVNGIKIQKDTLFSDVVKYGTKAQQRAFLVFDYNHDKVMQENEARNFNLFDCNVESDKQYLASGGEILTLTKKNSKRDNIRLKYCAGTDDSIFKWDVEKSLGSAQVYDNKIIISHGEKQYVSIDYDSIDVDIDLSEHACDGVEINKLVSKGTVSTYWTDLKISNARVDEISMDYGFNVEVRNTKPYNSSKGKTDLKTDNRIEIAIKDKKSKVNIKRNDDYKNLCKMVDECDTNNHSDMAKVLSAIRFTLLSQELSESLESKLLKEISDKTQYMDGAWKWKLKDGTTILRAEYGVGENFEYQGNVIILHKDGSVEGYNKNGETLSSDIIDKLCKGYGLKK